MEALHFLLDASQAPVDDALSNFGKALSGKLRIDADVETEEEVVVLDSFDWRLHHDELELTASDGFVTLRSRARRRGPAVDLEAEFQGLPAFLGDLPAGALRDTLAPALGLRRLLPMANFRRRRRALRFLDIRHKTVVRGSLEQAWLEDPDKLLERRLSLFPIRGYQRHLKQVRNTVESTLVASATRQRTADLACTASGRPPGGYTTRLDLALHGEMRADLALRLVHSRLLDILEDNLSGARQSLDIEFLHDFRVALRKSRTALSQVHGVYPQSTVDHFRVELRWLFRRTGTLRDLDVFLDALPGYRALLAPESIRDLDPLQDFLEARRQAEQQAVRELLGERRTRQILQSWRHFLDSELPGAGAPPAARTPIESIARAEITRLWKRVLQCGSRIDGTTPDAALHELRVEIKKLRYLFEFFENVLPPDVQAFPQYLRRLQSTLGRFADTVVQQRHVEQFAAEMAADGSASPQTLLAMGQLIPQLEDRRARERRQFENRFANLSAAKSRERISKALA